MNRQPLKTTSKTRAHVRRAVDRIERMVLYLSSEDKNYLVSLARLVVEHQSHHMELIRERKRAANLEDV